MNGPGQELFHHHALVSGHIGIDGSRDQEERKQGDFQSRHFHSQIDHDGGRQTVQSNGEVLLERQANSGAGSGQETDAGQDHCPGAPDHKGGEKNQGESNWEIGPSNKSCDVLHCSKRPFTPQKSQGLTRNGKIEFLSGKEHTGLFQLLWILIRSGGIKNKSDQLPSRVFFDKRLLRFNIELSVSDLQRREVFFSPVRYFKQFWPMPGKTQGQDGSDMYGQIEQIKECLAQRLFKDSPVKGKIRDSGIGLAIEEQKERQFLI